MPFPNIYASIALLLTLCATPAICTDIEPLTNAEIKAMAKSTGFSYATVVTELNVKVAHGAIMGFAFAFMYPAGIILIRGLTHHNTIWIHAFWQLFAYILTIVGVGMGIWMETLYHNFTYKNGHPIIGLIVFGLLTFLPFFAIAHHKIYKKSGRRNVFTYIHRWLGRVVVIVGTINGGLGLQYVDSYGDGALSQLGISYVVVAAVTWTMAIATLTLWHFRVRKADKTRLADMEGSQRGSDSSAVTADKEAEPAQ